MQNLLFLIWELRYWALDLCMDNTIVWVCFWDENIIRLSFIAVDLWIIILIWLWFGLIVIGGNGIWHITCIDLLLLNLSHINNILQWNMRPSIFNFLKALWHLIGGWPVRRMCLTINYYLYFLLYFQSVLSFVDRLPYLMVIHFFTLFLA